MLANFKKNLFNRELLWGFLAQGLNIASGLLLLPIVLRYLSTEEVGLWFVFMTLASFSQLLELGFQPTIARNVAYIYAGSQKLDAYGLNTNPSESPINFDLLKELFSASRIIYLFVALGAFFVLVIFGSLYISTLVDYTNLREILIAWLAFVTGYLINFYYGYFNSFLQGRGDVTKSNQVIAISRLSLIVFSVLFLICGKGLIGLGIASLLSSAIGRIFAGIYFWQDASSVTNKLKNVSFLKNNSLIPIIWHNASRFGLVGAGGFLITKANILIASSLLGLNEAASYALTFQILLAISGLAGVLLNLNMPKLNTYQANGNINEVKLRFSISLVAAWLVFTLCAMLLIIFGSETLVLLKSKTYLLNKSIILVFSFIMFLELTHSLCAVYLTTYNEIPFVRAALVSGLSIVILSLFFVAVLDLGVWGLLLSQGLVQASYNNWKWPREVEKKLNAPFINIVMFRFR